MTLVIDVFEKWYIEGSRRRFDRSAGLPKNSTYPLPTLFFTIIDYDRNDDNTAVFGFIDVDLT